MQANTEVPLSDQSHTHKQCANTKSLSEFIAIALFLTFTLCSLNADLLVVLLQGGKILTGLAELTFLHTLTDVPVHECTLAVHQVELVIDAGKHFSNGCGVADHAAGTHHFG